MSNLPAFHLMEEAHCKTQKLCDKLPLTYEMGSQDTPSPRADQEKRNQVHSSYLEWFLPMLIPSLDYVDRSFCPAQYGAVQSKETRRGLS